MAHDDAQPEAPAESSDRSGDRVVKDCTAHDELTQYKLAMPERELHSAPSPPNLPLSSESPPRQPQSQLELQSCSQPQQNQQLTAEKRPEPRQREDLEPLSQPQPEFELRLQQDAAPAPAPATSQREEAFEEPFSWEEYNVGDHILCLSSFDRTSHPAKVISMHTSATPSQTSTPKRRKCFRKQYYVHYFGYDRRLDEWVDESCIMGKVDKPVAREQGLRSHALKITPVQKTLKEQPADHTNENPQLLASPSSAHHASDDRQQNWSLASSQLKHGPSGHNDREPKVKNITTITIGNFEVDTWYYSPYPSEYQVNKLYICERCFKYMKTKGALIKHRAMCDLYHPPGDEIYRHNSKPLLASKTNVPSDDSTGCMAAVSSDGEPALSIFEVDGKKNVVYCQNLCLLAKLFLDHKFLYFEVDSFIFYVLAEFHPDGGYRPVGYFSKEKESKFQYVMSCLLVMPQHQRKRYGRLLISFAYLLARTTRQGCVGTPERPLSDLGQLSFMSFWTKTICEELRNVWPRTVSIQYLCSKTGICKPDAFGVLHELKLVPESACANYSRANWLSPKNNDKRWENNLDGTMRVQAASLEQLNRHIMKHSKSSDIELDPQKLRWRQRQLPQCTRKVRPQKN